jgi:hypothetical protein
MGCDFLESKDHFSPFAVTLQHDGTLQRSGELTAEEKDMNPEALIDKIKATLASGCRQKLHKAIALGTDVKVQRFKSEGYVRAIEVHIEHEDGYGFECFLPYRKEDNKLICGEIFSTSVPATSFEASKS